MSQVEVFVAPSAKGLPQTYSEPACAVIHVIDPDRDVRFVLTRWMSSRGIEVQVHDTPDDYLCAPHSLGPECLVVDARALLAGIATSALLPATSMPSIVATANQPDTPTVVASMRAGAIDVVEKPLREREVVSAVLRAIEIDRERRCSDAKGSELRARFSRLSRRERQVMALVTEGQLNKQVGATLGLSEVTIKTHRGAMMRKMGARTFADLVRMADIVADELSQLRSACSAQVRSAARADLRTGCSPGRA